MEYIDIYDYNKNKTGKFKERKEPLLAGEYSLISHVCLINKSKQMLIQKRTKNKKLYPGLWDLTIAGGAKKDENSNAAAEREALEELGLKLDLKNIRPNITVNYDDAFADFFSINWEGDIKNLKLAEDEVEQVKWASEQEIIDLIKKKEFTPYYPSLISYLFDICNKDDTHINI